MVRWDSGSAGCALTTLPSIHLSDPAHASALPIGAFTRIHATRSRAAASSTHLAMLGPTQTALWCISFILAGLFHSGTQGKQGSDAESDEKVYDLGPGITQPRVIKQVMPHYADSRAVRIEGSVTIQLVVSSRGLPKNPRVVKGIDKDVDQSALDAVAQWRFDPARKDGKPVAVRIVLEIEFHSM